MMSSRNRDEVVVQPPTSSSLIFGWTGAGLLWGIAAGGIVVAVSDVAMRGAPVIALLSIAVAVSPYLVIPALILVPVHFLAFTVWSVEVSFRPRLESRWFPLVACALCSAATMSLAWVSITYGLLHGAVVAREGLIWRDILLVFTGCFVGTVMPRRTIRALRLGVFASGAGVPHAGIRGEHG